MLLYTSAPLHYIFRPTTVSIATVSVLGVVSTYTKDKCLKINVVLVSNHTISQAT